MKKNYLLACSLILSIITNAQVGINTETPQATLDVNGNLIVRQVNLTPSNSNYDFLVVNPTSNEVQKVTGNFSGGSTTNTTIAKVSRSGGNNLLNVSLFDQWRKINFQPAGVSINSGNNFTASNDTYTVPSSGVYVINLNYRFNSGLQLSLLSFNGDPRIGVLRRITSSSYEIVDQKNFSAVNLGLGPIGIPIGVLSLVIADASINSIYVLNQGDVLTFGVYLGGLLDTDLLSNTSTSFFIYKISD